MALGIAWRSNGHSRRLPTRAPFQRAPRKPRSDEGAPERRGASYAMGQEKRELQTRGFIAPPNLL